jgi:hypothetical protein
LDREGIRCEGIGSGQAIAVYVLEDPFSDWVYALVATIDEDGTVTLDDVQIL